MPNAITMLKSDHATVKRLLRELNATTDRAVRQRETLVAEIERELKTHARLEEEIFYPAFHGAARDSEAEDLFYEAVEEHRVVDLVLPALKAATPKSKEFKARAKVLQGLVEHHIREEENEMFREARSLFDDAALREMGDRMQVRREQLEALWDKPLPGPAQKLPRAAHSLLPAKAKRVRAETVESR